LGVIWFASRPGDNFKSSQLNTLLLSWACKPNVKALSAAWWKARLVWLDQLWLDRLWLAGSGSIGSGSFVPGRTASWWKLPLPAA
jgi:hypothetical protein